MKKDIYAFMAKKPVFSIKDVDLYYGNMESSRSAVKRLLANMKVMKIRNDLYTCVDPATGGPIANRFQIASSITDSSYVSHHTAMEYHGITDQVFYDVYVSSKTRFHDFEFDGYTFRYINSRIDYGIETPAFSGGVKVTDIERTVLDSIKDMDKISGIEEVISNISMIRHLDERRLLEYLGSYSNKFLYQKTGFILQEFNEILGVSKEFFAECKIKKGNSKRYLTQDIGSDAVYVGEWDLIVPAEIFYLKNGMEVNNNDPI